MKKPVTCRLLAIPAALFLCLYVGIYVWLSAQGRFEPAFVGLNGVKDFDWAPRGFVQDYKWDRARLRVFFPLWYFDRTYWHRPGDAESGRYPINDQYPDDIWSRCRGPF